MASQSDHNDLVKSTKGGRMYIDTEDFFKQEKVQDIVERLVDSSIYKEIKSNQEGK